MARPFRYTLILASVAIGTVLAAAGGWRYARASAPLSGPVIIISVDTLRADHLPAYGYRKVKTPAIDALAADGVVFDRAYAHATETLPAHVSLLSGRLPFETGVRGDEGFVVKHGERLLPQLLRERGYATAAIVSTPHLGKDTGIGQGFDFFDDEVGVRRDGAESETIAEHWLNSAGTSRAFLFLQLYEPHTPYATIERFAQYQPYDAQIAYADEVVGRLIHYLKAHQLYDRTTIVLVSDHGEGLGDHGEQEHGLFLYTEAIHVPLIVKQESNVGAGRRIADVVQHIDIVPTILDFARAPIPGNLHGRSLKTVLERGGHLPERQVYSESLYAQARFGWGALTALTDAHHQYIKAPREEVYDLDRDFRERKNIAAGNVKVTADLRAALDRVSGGAHAVDALALPDPKDKPQVVETYRQALALADDRKWPQAIRLLQQLLHDDPMMTPVWRRLADMAIRVDRHDVALDAYKHLVALRPDEPSGYLGAATAQLKLRKFDEARMSAGLAADIGAEADKRSVALARDLLARIALARHDLATARAEAALAHEADAALQTPAFIDGRVLFDQGKYEEALPLFQQAADHFYTAETLAKLDRFDEAEAEYAEEILRAPENARARTGIATLYHTTGDTDAADKAVTDLVQATPTPDSYALAAKLLTAFGKPRQASALRAEAQRAFTSSHP